MDLCTEGVHEGDRFLLMAVICFILTSDSGEVDITGLGGWFSRQKKNVLW